MPHRTERPDGVDGARPQWFAAFLADRGTRKPSAHTLKAYRQDFDAIATLVAGDADGVSRMSLGDITTDSLRTAFAQYAETHEAASILRCWSTWNVVCNPASSAVRIRARSRCIQSVRPQIAAPSSASRSVPRRGRSAAWPRRANGRPGCRDSPRSRRPARADELVRANVGDLRRTDDGVVLHVRGKGGKDRRIPVEPALDGPAAMTRFHAPLDLVLDDLFEPLADPEHVGSEAIL